MPNLEAFYYNIYEECIGYSRSYIVSYITILGLLLRYIPFVSPIHSEPLLVASFDYPQWRNRYKGRIKWLRQFQRQKVPPYQDSLWYNHLRTFQSRILVETGHLNKPIFSYDLVWVLCQIYRSNKLHYVKKEIDK